MQGTPLPTTPDPATDEYGTTAEIRKRYKASYSTLGRWLKRGLPSRQLSPKHKILIRFRDVEQFLGAPRQIRPDTLDGLVREVLEDLQKKTGSSAPHAELRG